MTAKVAFPARCAVAVVCGEQLVSQVYPASVPIEVFIDNAVELLDGDLRRRGLGGLEPGAGYDLHKANGVRLDVTKTLDELGVEDGATLVLAPAVIGDSFEPQYESLSTGLARTGSRLFEPVTADTAAATATAIAAMAAATTLVLALRHRIATDSPLPSIVTGIAGALAVGAAVALRRWSARRTVLVAAACWLATPLLAVSLAAAAPGDIGSAHVVIAALAAAVLACTTVTVTQRAVDVAAAIVTSCGLGGAVAATRMWWPAPAQWLGMGTLVALLVLLTAAPTIALWSARIRPPHFGSITGRDLFRRGDGSPVDTVEPVSADDGAGDTGAAMPGGTRIVAAAMRANGVLTGTCVGAGLALPAAVWATIDPGRGSAATVLSGLFATIFICRGRAYADRRQAIALVCGAAAAVCAGIAKYVVERPANSATPVLAAAALLAGFALAGLVAGLVVPVTRFTPLVRMAAEWLELVAIIVALPLAAWIGGLFTWVRMR